VTEVIVAHRATGRRDGDVDGDGDGDGVVDVNVPDPRRPWA
jgi:hypothetical protein